MNINKTVAVTLAATIFLIGYDIWTLIDNGYDTTISWTMYVWAQKFPIIPFALGIVFGHMFWSNKAAQ